MSGGPRRLRVVIAEDSRVTRDYLTALLESDPAFDVVAAVADGAEAVEQALRFRPEVILMDIRMPRLDGLAATRRIMARVPTPIVLVTAGLEADAARQSFEAIRAGALTVLGKPAGAGHPDNARSERELLRALRTMSEVKLVRRWPVGDREAPASHRVLQAARRIRLVAAGASAGGPGALAELLRGLGGGIVVPILLVQHMPAGFTAGFVAWLADQTPLGVRVAAAAEPAQPGIVYVAPEGRQLGIGPDGRIRLEPGSGEEAFCPSVSHLFESAASSFGASAMGVLLTGMGTDGASGLRTLRSVRAVTVAQDEATSTVFGMPGEAVRVGAAEHVLPPREIAALIRTLAR